MISSSSSIRKTALSASSTSETVIRSNGLGRSGYQVRLTRGAVLSTASYHFDIVHLP